MKIVQIDLTGSKETQNLGKYKQVIGGTNEGDQIKGPVQDNSKNRQINTAS